MKRVGRPAEIDPETGETIAKSLVNVTIPTKLAEFLKRENVNRSKLFTKVVTQMYNDELCPKCYTTDVIKTPMGVRCNGFCSRHRDHWIKYNQCADCVEYFRPRYNAPIYIEEGVFVNGKQAHKYIGEKCCHAQTKL